jgi:hypothetical protein
MMEKKIPKPTLPPSLYAVSQHLLIEKDINHSHPLPISTSQIPTMNINTNVVILTTSTPHQKRAPPPILIPDIGSMSSNIPSEPGTTLPRDRPG